MNIKILGSNVCISESSHFKFCNNFFHLFTFFFLTINIIYVIKKFLVLYRPHLTAEPSLIFNGNESKAVWDGHTSLQWVALLFNVFFWIVLLEKNTAKMPFQEISIDRKHELRKSISDLEVLYIFLQWMPLKVSLSLTVQHMTLWAIEISKTNKLSL